MFDKIIERLSESAGTEELNLVNEAYNLAKERSKSEHYLRVASLVSELNADSTMIIAALLHDAYAKEDITYDEINEKFGSNIANLVANLIKLRSIKLNDYKYNNINIFKLYLSTYSKKQTVTLNENTYDYEIFTQDKLHNIPVLNNGLKTGTYTILSSISHDISLNDIIKNET